MNDSLSQLKDIHLPPPVSWWPPAPGWWLLAILVVITAIVLVRYLRRERHGRLYQASLRELNAIRAGFLEQQDPQRLAADLSRLLRRVAITLCPDPEVAGLTGKDWLAWLDAQIDSNDFTTGEGRFLEDGAYRPAAELQNAEALLTLVEKWLKQVTREATRV